MYTEHCISNANVFPHREQLYLHIELSCQSELYLQHGNEFLFLNCIEMHLTVPC